MMAGKLLTADEIRGVYLEHKTSRKSRAGSTARLIRKDIIKREDSSAIRNKIEKLYKEGASNRQVYREGMNDGEASRVKNLVDVLHVIRTKSLGRANVVQESNKHIIFRVFECICCKEGNTTENCYYIAGYLAGALKSCGKPQNLNVKEVACNEYPGRVCVFVASW
jgi:predicted hydrocarbon binding protein